MGETEARGLLHLFLFAGDSVLRTVGLCSAGERTRLQLAVLVLQGCNVLILDEPLNHLDIDGREYFEQALEAFEGSVNRSGAHAIEGSWAGQQGPTPMLPSPVTFH